MVTTNSFNDEPQSAWHGICFRREFFSATTWQIYATVAEIFNGGFL